MFYNADTIADYLTRRRALSRDIETMLEHAFKQAYLAQHKQKRWNAYGHSRAPIARRYQDKTSDAM